MKGVFKRNCYLHDYNLLFLDFSNGEMPVSKLDNITHEVGHHLFNHLWNETMKELGSSSPSKGQHSLLRFTHLSDLDEFFVTSQ